MKGVITPDSRAHSRLAQLQNITRDLITSVTPGGCFRNKFRLKIYIYSHPLHNWQISVLLRSRLIESLLPFLYSAGTYAFAAELFQPSSKIALLQTNFCFLLQAVSSLPECQGFDKYMCRKPSNGWTRHGGFRIWFHRMKMKKNI